MKSWIVTPSEEGVNGLKYVCRTLPAASMGLIRKSMRKKNITLNGKKMEGKEHLKAGDKVAIWFSDETLSKFMGNEKVEPKAEGLPHFEDFIIYEDENILALNKPAGLLSQGDSSGSLSLNDGVLSYLKDFITPAFKPSICNRLDRNTSGLLLAGKNMEALQVLNDLIRSRSVHKYYEALVLGEVPGEGVFKGYMAKDREKNQVSFSEKPVRGSLPAETRFERLKTLTKNGITFSLVKILLVTGRSHQIRVHFQAAGHPLLGEKKYGSEESISASEKLHIRRQMLHAFRLGFPEMEGNLSNLSGKVMEAPLPEDFRKVMGIRR